MKLNRHVLHRELLVVGLIFAAILVLLIGSNAQGSLELGNLPAPIRTQVRQVVVEAVGAEAVAWALVIYALTGAIRLAHWVVAAQRKDRLPD